MQGFLGSRFRNDTLFPTCISLAKTSLVVKLKVKDMSDSAHPQLGHHDGVHTWGAGARLEPVIHPAYGAQAKKGHLIWLRPQA